MKQLAAILLFVIILFNFYGYTLVICYMELSSDVSFEKKIDHNDYDEDDLVTIKIKLHLPYYTSSEKYERTYGSVNINGDNYRYVKRRIHDDTLELLCLPNQTATQLQAIHMELTNALVEDKASSQRKNKTINISLPVFFQRTKIFSLSCFKKVSQVYFYEPYFISTGYCEPPRKPPKCYLKISFT